MGKKLASMIFVIGMVLSLITVVFMGLFSVWTFFGILMIGSLYLGGYLYVVNFYYFSLEQEKKEKENKKTLDWCWSKANQILRRMPDGQGIEWRRGIGRQSEFRTFNDGIQNRPFRSMMGYLANTQQFIIIILDIDKEDIVRFHADPSPDVIEDHYYKFQPFQGTGVSSGMDNYGRDRYGRYPSRSKYGSSRSKRGLSIHVGDRDDMDVGFEHPSGNNNAETEKIADKALEKLKK